MANMKWKDDDGSAPALLHTMMKDIPMHIELNVHHLMKIDYEQDPSFAIDTVYKQDPSMKSSWYLDDDKDDDDLSSTAAFSFDLPPTPTTIATGPHFETSDDTVSISKFLTFATYDEVMEIPHVSDMSDQEIQDTWMSPDEVDTMRKECLVSIWQIENNGNNTNDICTRGLWFHTELVSAQRREVRNIMYEAMDEIIRHTFPGPEREELLAEISRACSADSVRKSLATAEWDAIEAR
eukprot:scaffold3924_cov109-Cylindrotheca_fusiformis.AAC.1